MTGKANAVFWIGLIIILANFWISGQSTVIWDMFTGVVAPKVSTGGGGGTKNVPSPGNAPPIIGQR
jgi:hypothetical protein